MKKIFLFLLLVISLSSSHAAKNLVLKSPDGSIRTEIRLYSLLWFDVSQDGIPILQDSYLSIQSFDSPAQGFFDPSEQPNKLKSTKTASVDRMVYSPFSRQESMRDHYNSLTLNFSGGWSVEFRAYNEGVAYRLVYQGKDTLKVNEQCLFHTGHDNEVWAPYVSRYKEGNRSVQYGTSFENLYTHDKLSALNADRNCFLPILIDCPKGRKLCLGESHLEHSPGLYLHADSTTRGSLLGDHAPYPIKMEQGGHNNLQMLVSEAAPYQAILPPGTDLPWRIMMISRDDAELLSNNMTYLLGAPCRIDDLSWIKPGKVAWDWWNDWNLQGVDFPTGINNDTYKYYIDFASKQGVEYVILDEGWAVNRQCDLFQVVPEIDLPMLVKYAEQRNVGIILWAGYWAFDRDMEQVCKHYSDMGVKGFKVDFMDRDDQLMTDFFYRAAATAARHHLLLDFHGAFKPSGLNRTYPNVLNFEGVSGLEQLKWAPTDWDQVSYECLIPFIRQTSGPMDYTQGAMLNAAKGHYHPSWSEPMSQGTRCRQLALYVVLESPLNMMCDSPTNYEREPECTQLIAGIPTVWDETVVLQGEVGEYVVVARRSGKDWYIGGITNWTSRDVTLDLSDYRFDHFLLFQDGANAHRKGSDYKLVTLPFMPTYTIHMAPGGGFLMKLIP